MKKIVTDCRIKGSWIRFLEEGGYLKYACRENLIKWILKIIREKSLSNIEFLFRNEYKFLLESEEFKQILSYDIIKKEIKEGLKTQNNRKLAL